MPPMMPLLRLLRPHQWLKNGFVFVGLLFGHAWNDPVKLGQALAAFAAFCLLASAVYVMNDLIDREQDRLHPKKKSRPLAAGTVAVGAAKALAAPACSAAARSPGLGRLGAVDLLRLRAAQCRLQLRPQACGDPRRFHHRFRLHAAHPRRHAGPGHRAVAVAAAVRPDADPVPRLRQASCRALALQADSAAIAACWSITRRRCSTSSSASPRPAR
jgi:hypothetical protein